MHNDALENERKQVYQLPDMTELGKTLFIAGLVLSAVGGLLWLAGRWNLPQLPGDIRIDKPGFKFYFPLTTCLLLSALVSLILWLLRKR